MQETWLHCGDECIFEEIKEQGLKMHLCNRDSAGGGVAIFHKPWLKSEKLKSLSFQTNTFEYVACMFHTSPTNH